jgi:hypothetical protein
VRKIFFIVIALVFLFALGKTTSYAATCTGAKGTCRSLQACSVQGGGTIPGTFTDCTGAADVCCSANAPVNPPANPPASIGCGVGQVATLSCFVPMFHNIVNWALILAGAVSLIFILIGAIQFLTSSGDQKRVDSAKKTMTFAIVGIVLIFLSFAIINFLAYTTGASCIKLLGFDVCK